LINLYNSLIIFSTSTGVTHGGAGGGAGLGQRRGNADSGCPWEEGWVTITSNLAAGRDEEYMQEYNAAVDGLEAMLIALGPLGLLDRFSKEELTSAVTTALAGISNHLT
jgi:hypothetical protein